MCNITDNTTGQMSDGGWDFYCQRYLLQVQQQSVYPNTVSGTTENKTRTLMLSQYTVITFDKTFNVFSRH